MKSPLGRLALVAAFAQLLLVPAAVRHRYFWGGDTLAPYLHVFELLSLLASQGLGLWVLWRAFRCVDRGEGDVRAIWRGTGWIALAALCVLPFLSDDVFAYDVRGRILALHGGNPYVDVATQYAAQDPLVDVANRWHRYPNPYGPLFTLVQGGIAWISHLLPAGVELQQLSSVLFYKFVAILALLGGARALARTARDAQELQRGLLFVLWNPLLWLEGVVHAHNDLLLGAALLAAVAAVRRGRFAQAAFWLWMGAEVKFVSLALGPLFFVLALRSRRLRAFVGGNLLGAVPFAALGLWFWSGPHGLDWLTQQGQLHGASLQLLVIQALGGAERLGEIVRAGFPLLAVAFAFYAAWRCRALEDAARWSVRVLFVLIFVGLIWAGPWYHLWWLPLALTPALRPRRPALVLLVTAPLSYTIWLAARDLGPTHEWTQWTLGMLLPALAFALPARDRAATGDASA